MGKPGTGCIEHPKKVAERADTLRMDGSLYGYSVPLIVDATGVHPDTARRWKRSKLPECRRRLIELGLHGELGAIDPTWRGFALKKGVIWTPENEPVSFGELRAIPYRRQLIEELQRQLKRPQQYEFQGFAAGI